MDGSLTPAEGCPPIQRNFNDMGSKSSTKKSKRGVLFFEVEILDAKTREKLCFLDKVRTLIEGWQGRMRGEVCLWSLQSFMVH